MRHLLRFSAFLIAAVVLLPSSEASAQRMVSVSSKELNLRSGPGTQHSAEWVLSRGYPLEVIGRQGQWLRVRDFEKDTGWVYQPLTNTTPHHIVTVKTANMRSEPTTTSRIVAKLIYGETLRTLKRSEGWVKVQRENGLRGWVARRLLWGW